MKKFLLSVAAVALSVASYAATPDQLFVVGNIAGHDWNTVDTPEMTKDGDTFTATVTLAGSEASYFSFIGALGANWDEVNAQEHRWGAAAEDGFGFDMPQTLVEYPTADVVIKDTPAFKFEGTGDVTIVVDFATMQVTVTDAAGIESIDVDNSAAVYYNLNGVRVANPQEGIFVKVANGKASKVMVK